MFGYLMALPGQMDEASCARYRALYCGLCRSLGRRYGLAGRMTLRYDLAFLAGLLLALPDQQEAPCRQARCLFRGGKTCMQAQAPALDYCADVNVLLAYYKLEDDWQDDRNLVALLFRQLLKPAWRKARQAQAQKDAAVRQGLAELSQIERRGEPLPDVPADCFGALMGALFTPDILNENREKMFELGCALGRLIYMMDATVDLRGDLKRGRYNPLSFVTLTDNKVVLEMVAARASDIYETLPIGRDKAMMDAIIYVGVWNRYLALQARREKRGEKKRRRNAPL